MGSSGPLQKVNVMQQENAFSGERRNGILNGKTVPLKPGAILATLNVICLFAFGGMLWGVETNRMEELKARADDLRSQLISVNTRLDLHEKALNDARNVETNRLSVVESDIKYISQTLQELKILLQKR